MSGLKVGIRQNDFAKIRKKIGTFVKTRISDGFYECSYIYYAESLLFCGWNLTD